MEMDAFNVDGFSARPRPTTLRVLFLDDDHRRHKAFKRAAQAGIVIDWAFDAGGAIRLLEHHQYDQVHLDHDLDDDPAAWEMDDYESGQVVANWLAENAAGRENCRFVIHSRSRQGANAMQATLRSAGLQVSVARWDW